ncbi:hypothetical protein ISS21_00610 [Patescibacteria group bacterium]|nr:hypothetical protein [Patescibacteria group bacterium]
MEIIKPNPKPIRLFFFWAGVIATLAYRIIIVLNFYSPLWVKISWYIGTIGFIIYFGHRFDIQKKRSELVADYKLVEVVEKAPCVDEKQKQALKYIVKTSLTSKSRWNSAFIFILSVLALIVGIIMDIM